MANPRRTSNPINPEIPIHTPNFQSQTLASRFTKLKLFLKKPQAFPLLLSILLILTWVSLRIHQSNPKIPNQRFSTNNNQVQDQDRDANLIRFKSQFPSPITKDGRGWILDPVSIALDSGISGGASICASIHVGEIKPGGVRGNHRHHTCNETFLIWGARTVFRVENDKLEKGYAQVTVGVDDVAVAGSPMGRAHALVNVDSSRSTFIVGCQDRVISHNKSNSDFRVWDDLNS